MGEFDSALGQAFDFSADDLAANRSGRLSGDQETVWRNTVRGRDLGARRGVRLLVFGIAGAAAAAAVVGSRTPGTGAGAGIFVAVVLGLIGGFAGMFIVRGRRATRALRGAELRVSEGPFSWTSDLNGRWWGEVADARFGIDRLREERLTTGASYRVYWLPLDGSAWVQSIERV